MTKMTNFSRFRHAVETWVGENIVDRLRPELETGRMDADPADIIETESGLFSLFLMDNQIFVTKVILHITDYSLSRLNQDPAAATEYSLGNHDAPPILEKVNKYHFLQCGTLDWMFGNKRRFRYKRSRRKDGKFNYIFTRGNKVDLERHDQKLYPCMNCLRRFPRPHGGRYRRETFLPEDFFSRAFPSNWLEDWGYSTDSEPNVYSPDFKRISDRVRELRNYTCEACGECLGAQEDRKFLHCHHLHGDKTDNSYARLQALCIRCHSDEPLHQHLRGTQRYREFMEKFHGGK